MRTAQGIIVFLIRQIVDPDRTPQFVASDKRMHCLALIQLPLHLCSTIEMLK